jgi:molybdopterin converting factor small subunit
MIRLALAAPLFDLLPEDERSGSLRQRSLVLEAESWGDVVEEVRRRCPVLAKKVLADSGGISPGFVLVVNDEVQPPSTRDFDVSEGDELSLIAAIAGG